MYSEVSRRTNTYFISDLHLGAAYLDRPIDRERAIVGFLRSIAADAARIYLVGDILDYWFEYRTVVPRGYVRFFGALAEIADSGVEITWLIGNHDIWMFDYLRDQIGIKVVDGAVTTDIDGRRFFICHGDGLGKLAPSFRFIRSMFRNRFCQKIYAAIHPRWTVGFAHWWSASNRDYDRAPRPVFSGAMKDGVEAWAESYVSEHPEVDFIILGHHHVMVDEAVGPKARLVILGDWIYNYSYAEFDGEKLELKQYATALSEFNNISQ